MHERLILIDYLEKLSNLADEMMLSESEKIKEFRNKVLDLCLELVEKIEEVNHVN